jgi:hypothetical protein
MSVKEVIIVMLIILIVWYYYTHQDVINQEVSDVWYNWIAPPTAETFDPVGTIVDYVDPPKQEVNLPGTEGAYDGMDYGSYALSNAVDAGVIKNQIAYANEEMSKRTARGPMRTAVFEEQEANPWQGIRRPQQVYVNPDSAQVADVDTSAYRGSTLRW